MRSLLAGHPLTIDNSFEELPSPELGTFQMQTGATLTSQYPYGFAFLAAPFFDLFGLHGPFVLNALAFVAVLALTWRIGKTVLRDERLAWLGVGIFLFGTYAWEYSMAAWPQMTGLVASLGVFSLVLLLA